MIKFTVNNKGFEGLWDTGSMISLDSYEWVKNEFLNIKIETLDSFLGTKASDLKIRAAKYQTRRREIVTFNFYIKDNSIYPDYRS